MSYQPLDDQSVITYLQQTAPQVGRLASQIGIDNALHAREVGDGNLNQVFIVTVGSQDSPSATIIVKQALPYLRVSGEGWPLSRERMRFETQALLKYSELMPELVPEIYHHDLEMSLVVMEYLDGFEVMRGPITKGQRFPNFAINIAEFTARSHFFTSDAYLTSANKKAAQAAFINPELCKLQEDFVFTNPFMTSPENNWNPLLEPDIIKLRGNATLKVTINQTKYDYMTNAQAMLHGDLHTGSLMVQGDELKIIDPEFAFYGPQAYDVGTLLANIVLGAASQVHHTPDEAARQDYQAYLLDLIEPIWQHYAQTFDRLWQDHTAAGTGGDLSPASYWEFAGGAEAFTSYRHNYLQDVLASTARHGGCELLRRLMGIVSVAELSSIPDDNIRVIAERQVLDIASEWLSVPVTSINMLADAARHVILDVSDT
ncbi:MAG: S-methyl-5-thioribose kinase [Deinococcota bacterium]